MLSELLRMLRKYDMLRAGDSVTVAVSGGADSMALLFGLYLLREKLHITLCAAHFNHRLRGAESDRDEAFVRAFCERMDIPLVVGSGSVTAGEKGLEAAARDARYAFFATLPGKIATAHTADDNAETVLMHLVRGTGLKGLGAIAPVRGNIIRPMLLVTREQVLKFLEEYRVDYVNDTTNDSSDFLRNRLRHAVMPLLRAENPRFSENLSEMALRLRADEAALQSLSECGDTLDVEALRGMNNACRSRTISAFLEKSGVKEPEAGHIALAESLIFSDKPSAWAQFPNGVILRRSYNVLLCAETGLPLERCRLQSGERTVIPQLGIQVVCTPSDQALNSAYAFTVATCGSVYLRSREAGDEIRLTGGTKKLKKLFIDRKIPAHLRPLIPVIADEKGVLGVYGIGANLDRLGNGTMIQFEAIHSSDML